MNPNVEIITPELWAVNREYIKAGWIQELHPTSDFDSSTNKNASLTDSGIMILNKGSEFYPLLKQFVPKIMQHSNEELQQCYQSMTNKIFLDNHEKLYLNVLEWEMKRRRVRSEYLNSLQHPIIRIIKILLKKVGEKLGYYQNGD